MKLIRSLLAATMIAAVATPAVAQFDKNSTTSTDQLRLVSSGPYSPYGTYTGRLLQSPGQPIIDMWCDDFTHNFQQNRLINVTRFDASQTDFDARTRFGYAKLDDYKKAAYLTQFFAGLTNAAQVQDLHSAIWHLMTPGAPGAIRPGEATWINLLGGGDWANINTQYWFVLTDQRVNDGVTRPSLTSQEQLTMVAPEPSAVILVSTGLLGIVGLARMRRRGTKKD